MPENEYPPGAYSEGEYRFDDEDAGAAGPPPPPPPPINPASLPQGFWNRVDYMLHNPEKIVESIRRDEDLMPLCQTLLFAAFIMSVIYGAVMGATNLLQGSEMPFFGKLLMIAISAIKVPLLFLLTLVIVLPPVYVSNAFVGAQFSFRQMLACLLATVAITTTVLASMASVAFFFALTSKSYNFIKLLHVLFFVYAGVMGLGYLDRTVSQIAEYGGRRTPRRILLVWILLYMFVGTQLAWVLRPFVGSPDLELTIFRPRTGNFYESVIQSMRSMAEDMDDRGNVRRPDTVSGSPTRGEAKPEY